MERHGQASLCRRPPSARGAGPGLEEDLASAPRPRWKSVAPRCRVIKWPVRAHFSILSPPTLAQPHRLESPLSRPAQPCPRQVLAWEADLLPSPTTRRRVALSAGSFCSSSFPFPLRPSRLPGFRSLPQSPTIPQTPAVTMRRSGRWQQPRGKQRQPQLRRRPAGQCLTRILVSSHSLLRPSFGSEQQQRSSRGGRRRRSRERGWERWNRRFFPRSSSSGPSRFDAG